MADETTCRIERVLIEPLESRTLLSAVLLQQPQIVLEAAPAAPGPVVLAVRRDLVVEPSDALSAGPLFWQPRIPELHAFRAGDWQSSADSAAQFHAGDEVDHHDGFGPSVLRQNSSAGLPEFSDEEYSDLSQWQSAIAPEHPLLARPGADAPSAIVVLTGQDGSTEVIVLQGGQPGNSRVVLVSEDTGAPLKPDAARPPHPDAAATVQPPATASQTAAASSVAASHSQNAQPASLPAIAAAAQNVAAPLRIARLSASPRVDIDVRAVARSAELSARGEPSSLDAQPLTTPDALPITGSISSSGAPALAAAGAQPAVAAGAVRIAAGWVRAAAAAVGQAFDQPGSVVDAPAEALAPAAYNVLRISPAMLFNDTVGRIIREGAAVSSATPDAAPNHTRAWAITGAVVLADAILVMQWQLKRRKQLRLAGQRPPQRVFCTARV